MSKLATLELQRKGALDLADALYNENEQLKKQIEKFKQIAVHVQEHCCDDCEDSSMCDFGCAITELKQSIVTEKKEVNK